MCKDTNGVELNDGDNVSAIKDLAVKGMKLKIKRGSVIKKIKLTNKDNEIECRVGKSTIVLKTEFFKKS
jgi:protein PhnA